MYTTGRDNIEGYNFKSEENLKNLREFFIPSLQQIQKLTNPKLIAKQDGLQYVESLILKLLGAIISTNGSGGGPTMLPLYTTNDVEDRIRRLIPEPKEFIVVKTKVKEILSALRNSKRILFHGTDPSPLKTPVDKFHQHLQKDLCHKIDIQASQYLLAVLEYIATDILQLAGHYVSNMIHTEITAQEIRAAINADKFLMDIFYKDEDEVDGPPLSANCYYHQSFFDSDFNDGEYGNIGNHTITYQEAVREFIQEERQFIRELSLIIKVFRDPLVGVLQEEDLQKIFINIDDIYEFSIKFLGLLEDAVEVADEDDRPAIGSCFIEIAEDEEMDVFRKYAQNAMNFSFRDHLYYVLSQHSLSSQIKEIFSTRYSSGMLATLQYVLPRLLLLPIYHCFSYFKAIEKLKELTPFDNDRENYEQADSTLQSLRNVLEKQKKLNKFGDGYFLRLYGRTHRATASAKIKEIQSSIEDWRGKDIWQSCTEFIREGVLYKVSHSGKSIGHLSNRLFLTERRAFLFDNLLVLCKHSTKRIVPGRGDNSQLEWRWKESYQIRNIEISERDDPLGHLNSNSSSLLSNFGGHSNYNNNNNNNNNHSNNNNSDGISMLDQPFSSLSSSVSNISHTTFNSYNEYNNGNHAFEISQNKRNQSHTLVAKTAEEKDSWMSQLILLNKRPMLERALDAKLSEEAKKHPLVLPHPSVYRFAIEDMETNIIFEENKSNSNVPLIKGATLLKLIERLTYHNYGDPALVRIFLATYRSFCTPSELLKLLIERFEIPEPDFLSCMQAMHYSNDDLSSPTSMAPPAQESSLLSSNSNSSEHSNHDVVAASDSMSSSIGPASPKSPTLSVNSHLPANHSDLNVFFDEQDEQCQQYYKEMLKRFRKEYAQPVQFRVLNVLRHWIFKHFYDFERDNQLLDMLNEFLNEKLAKSHTKVAKWCQHIRNVIDRSKKTSDQRQQLNDNVSLCSEKFSGTIERSILSHFNSEEFDLLLAFSPETVATHLTLFEFELYRAVKPHELIGTDEESCVWTKKDKQKTSPNLLKMMRHYTIMSYYFEKCIVEAENFEERVAIVTRILEILIILIKNNNFNGAFEITTALESAPIFRLDHTRAQVEKNTKLKKAFEEARELTDNHHKKYKEKLFSINPPCVPFFGNFLTNIVHLEEGNPPYLEPPNNVENISIHKSSSNTTAPNGSSLMQLSSKMINFQKKRKVAETISMIQQYQNEPYNQLKMDNPTIKNFFENLDLIVFPEMGNNLEEEEKLNDYLYNKSLEIEPRGCKQPPKFPRRWPDRNLKQISKAKNIRLPSISGISHPINPGSNSNNHCSGSVVSHNHIDSDSISLQQQQSPSTPLTPTAPNDAIFATVIIGGGANTPHISPTTPSLNQPLSFFPSGPLSSSSTLVNHPATPTHTSMNNHGNCSGNYSSAVSSSPLSPPLSSSTSEFPMVSSPTFLNDEPPPLPPRGVRSRAPQEPTLDESEFAPPLPPRTYKRGSQPPPKISFRDNRPTPLPRIPPPLSSAVNSQHYHQRVNSDIVLSSSSSPTANIVTNGGPTIVRRNSTMDNCTTLPPRRFSQGHSAPPLPPPLPPTPLTPSPNASALFNLIPGQPSSPSPHHPPPPLPTISSPMMRQPPISPSNNCSNTATAVPELPPKTYRDRQNTEH